ncbi:MAG: disulfide bond formation protein B [Rickettsiales bacterium]|nr:disulfide bond formation protein B [Rickettsiales bacterium]
MNFINTENFIKCTLLLSFVVLTSVYVMEFVFLILPCKLCLLQRYPYFLILIISLCYVSFKLKQYEKLVLVLIIICFLVVLSLSLYHSLIELNLIDNALNCASSGEFENFAEMHKSIIGKAAVSCDMATYKIMKLSLSNWNIIVSLIMLTLASFSFLRK